MTALDPELRSAVAGIVAWYEELLDGTAPSIVRLQHALDDLRRTGPFPPGPIADDIYRLLKPGPASARLDILQGLAVPTGQRPGTSLPEHSERLVEPQPNWVRQCRKIPFHQVYRIRPTGPTRPTTASN